MERHQRMEHLDAKERGGKKRLNSGRTWFEKGDTSDEFFLVDVKDAQSAKSYSINFKQLEKHLHDAQREGRLGMIKVYWKDSLGRTRRLAIVEESVLEPLMEKKEDA